MTEFERFACYVRNIGTVTFLSIVASGSERPTTAIMNEMAVLSSGEITTLCSENIMLRKHYVSEA